MSYHDKILELEPNEDKANAARIYVEGDNRHDQSYRNGYCEARREATNIGDEADEEIADLKDLIWRCYQERVAETKGELDDTDTWREAERVGKKK